MNEWRKSSYSFSNGNCVEAAGRWRKSSHSMSNGHCVEAIGNWRKSKISANNGACVEIGQDGTIVLVRDSKYSNGPMLEFSTEVWSKFVKRLTDA